MGNAFKKSKIPSTETPNTSARSDLMRSQPFPLDFQHSTTSMNEVAIQLGAKLRIPDDLDEHELLVSKSDSW